MLNKLFSVKTHNAHRIVTFLGIKLSFWDSKLAIKQIREKLRKTNYIQHRLIKGKYFLYQNIKQFDVKQKIWYISQLFYQLNGYFPNIKKPRTFNEKLCWMKFNYFDPTESLCTDKYEFKNYIKEKLGDGYTVPLIGVYDDVNSIDFNTLPQQFVAKTTGNSTSRGIQIVRNKAELNTEKLKNDLDDYLQEWHKAYWNHLSPQYRDIKQRIIIEEYIEEIEKSNCDYKFFCFHGQIKCFYLTNSWAKHKVLPMAYYDMNMNRLPILYGDHPALKIDHLKKPKHFDKMVEIVKILSAEFPFVRIDLYNAGDRVLVGEFTFTPGAGCGSYEPMEWEYKLGSWIDLSKIPTERLRILPEFAEAAKMFIDPAIVEKCTVNTHA